MPLLLLPLILKKKSLFIPVFILIFGLFYYQSFQPDFILPLFEGEEVTVKGRVIEDDRDVIQVDKLNRKEINEKIIIYTDGNLQYGQVVELTGKPVLPDSEFKNYFLQDGISAIFFDPEIRMLSQKRSPGYYIYSFRRELKTKISKGVDFPESTIIKAILLGDRTRLPNRLQDKFSKVGVAHLLAVSGTHIVIIAGVITGVLSFLTFKWKTFLSLALLSLFVFMVGAPPSAIRAGFIGSFFIIAQKMERRADSVRGLTFIAFLMVLINPHILKNIGFQLSFLAALGITLFSQKIYIFLTARKRRYKRGLLSDFNDLLTKFFRKVPEFISKTISITLAAQIFTLPLVYYYFGNLPFIAPLSNLILAPLLPVVMIFGLISLFLSFFIPEFLAFSFTLVTVRIILFLIELFYQLCLLC